MPRFRKLVRDLTSSREWSEIPLSEPWISGPVISRSALFGADRLLGTVVFTVSFSSFSFFIVPPVVVVLISSCDCFWELFLLMSDVSEPGSWEDLSEMGLRMLSLLWTTTGARSGKAIVGPESELCELKEDDWRESELDVLRLPSLVLDLRDSMLPPLSEVAMLSVEEKFRPRCL